MQKLIPFKICIKKKNTKIAIVVIVIIITSLAKIENAAGEENNGIFDMYLEFSVNICVPEIRALHFKLVSV